ncbi:hypothetical protein RZE82_02230 [Mollicutes bacterium LVI A0039]|nr:hypothetical protein RZE82_02230 [Mollicutes bacterium LVI A0039]
MFIYIGLILLLSVIFFFVCMQINKYTKIPMLLIYVIFGWILQYSGINKFPDLVINIEMYVQMVSITLIYFLAGQAFNMKKQDKLTLQLGLLPIMLTILINVVILIIAQTFIFPDLNVPVWMLIALLGIAATSTPVLFLIHYNKLAAEQQGDAGVLKILNGALFDQIPGMLVILIPITIGVGMMNADGTITSTATQLSIAIIGMALAILIGFISGKITLLIANKITENIVAIMVVLVVISASIVNLVPFLAGQYLLVAVGIGLSINVGETKRLQQFTMQTNKLAAMFAFPMMFASIGIAVSLRDVFNVQMMVLAVVVFLFVPVLKSLIVDRILAKDDFTAKQRRVAIAFTLLTGSAYINMAVSFKPYFVLLGYDTLDQSLSIVGIILYIFSIVMLPIYGKQENNIIDTLFRLK